MRGHAPIVARGCDRHRWYVPVPSRLLLACFADFGFSRAQAVLHSLCRGLICRMVPEFGLLGRTGMLLVLA